MAVGCFFGATMYCILSKYVLHEFDVPGVLTCLRNVHQSAITTNLSAPAEWHFLMNLRKSFILPHGDMDGRFSGYKNDF